MKYYLAILIYCIAFVFMTSSVFAQSAGTADTSIIWKTVKDKDADTKLRMKIISTKTGKQLKWDNDEKRFVTLEIYYARGPVNAKGEFTISNKGKMIVLSADKMPIGDFKKGLQPGYYAVRIVENLGPTISLRSNWVVVKVD